MMEFFKTIMGKRFFEGHVPQLVKHLGDIAVELKRANDLKERELGERSVKAADKWDGHNPDPQGKRPEPPKAPPKAQKGLFDNTEAGYIGVITVQPAQFSCQHHECGKCYAPMFAESNDEEFKCNNPQECKEYARQLNEGTAKRVPPQQPDAPSRRDVRGYQQVNTEKTTSPPRRR